MTRRLLVALAAVALLAGCGEGTGGKARLWVSRDQGAEVLHRETVPGGLTAMQALMRVARVDTRYSGTFVQGIDGVSGGEDGDWFYYVNGYEADHGAAEYRLRPGDVEWWDFYAWQSRDEVPLVVGAFPEPFLHGFAGRRRPAVVRFGRGLAAEARALAHVIGARSVASAARGAPRGANLLLVLPGKERAELRFRAGSGRPGDPVVLRLGGARLARALARDPTYLRFQFRLP